MGFECKTAALSEKSRPGRVKGRTRALRTSAGRASAALTGCERPEVPPDAQRVATDAQRTALGDDGEVAADGAAGCVASHDPSKGSLVLSPMEDFALGEDTMARTEGIAHADNRRMSSIMQSTSSLGDSGRLSSGCI